ncbi:OmpA family protein [Chitinophagaceae bacterium LWZ2-11]
MKKYFLLLSINLLLLSTVFAQSTQDWKKPASFGLGFFLKDFQTPYKINTTSFSNVWKNGLWSSIGDMNQGGTAQFIKGLSNHVDFRTGLSISSVQYIHKGKPYYSENQLLIEADANINVKLLTDRYFLVPYLTAGVGASMYNANYFNAYAPVGGGLQFKVTKNTFIYTQMTYLIGVSTDAKESFDYTIMVSVPIAKNKKTKKVTPKILPVVILDTDGDGVPDSIDKCPTVKGLAKYAGCPIPDTDGDGINDEEDKCPTVKGVAKYQGCPIPDTDGDGINDEEDRCPTVKGVAKYQGCPIPDTDGDGVNDEEDLCPTVPGPASNHGCPVEKIENKEYTKTVYFSLGSAKITAKGYSALDEVVKQLAVGKDATVTIGGHGDSVGSDVVNDKISAERAEAVKAYLVKKGIDASRITTEGFGKKDPVGDNKTAAGRAKNRRAEVKATYKISIK